VTNSPTRDADAIPLDAPGDCRVYVFEGWDPHSGYTAKTVVYVGETGRLPFERLLEHVYDQPWSDTITSWRVLDEVYPDKASVLRAEDAAIKALCPLYNYEGNLGNPARIPIPEARRQRATRDAARGAQPWTAPAGPTGDVERARPQRSSLSPVWRRRRNVFLIRGTAWLVLAVAVWVVCVRFLHLSPFRSAGPSACLSGAAMVWTAPYWRRHRGLSRRTCKMLAALLTFAAFAAVYLTRH
jgi:hypothetical protein